MVTQHVFEGRLVVALCKENNGIGYEGKLPWPHLSKDMLFFKNLTMDSAVLMGSVTYFSIPEKFRPLPGRLNIVLSSRTRDELECPDSVLIAGSMDAAASLLKSRNVKLVFVIGGEATYREALRNPQWSSRVYLTEIRTPHAADRFFPEDMESENSQFVPVSISAEIEEKGIRYHMKEYVRRSLIKQNEPPLRTPEVHEENQYLNLVRKILSEGVKKTDRTDTGTLSVFGARMKFNLRQSFPLLTTKRVFWRGVAEELFWFIKGGTNANELSEKGIHIWDGNGSREFLDSRGLIEREVGDLGPVYGFQWRHFGAEYTHMHAKYDEKGIDQLKNVIETIMKNPNDRRILLSAWNPAAIDQMALPPCHMMAQFYVANGELSCQMYQRSCDMGLGRSESPLPDLQSLLQNAEDKILA
ncbi:unnamed protein product [Agarophyton chilense]